MERWELLASLRHLPDTIQVDWYHPEVIPSAQLPPEIQTRLNASDSSVKHLIKNQVELVFLLERYGKSYCICWSIRGFSLDGQPLQDDDIYPSQQTNEAEHDWSRLEFKELLNRWREPSLERSVKDPIKLNMGLPESSLSRARTDHTDMTPECYFETKYYESLFFLHLPLAYFVKSSLERFKSMCRSASPKDANKAYKQPLFSKLIGNKDFDERHENDNMLKNPINNVAAMESRERALSKYCRTVEKEYEDKILKDFSTILRIREIKLQIIILLENIYLNNLDASFKDFEAKYRSKLRKRSLNLTRLASGRLKRSSLTKVKDQAAQREIDCCEELDLYLDKLCILDVLLASEPFKINNSANIVHEHKQSILNRNKEASSLGFANLVLVPYFTGKVPNAIRFIIHKLKGPSLRNKKVFRRKNAAVELEDNLAGNLVNSSLKLASRSSSIASAHPTSPDESKTPVMLHTMMNPTSELIATRSSSNLDSFFEVNPSMKRFPSTISRTSSDLTMNHLQKRQLSVAEFTSKNSVSAGKSLSTTTKMASSSFTSQQSFGRVGKRKGPGQISRSDSNVASDHESNLVQVMSTPLKRIEKVSKTRATLHNIVESPLNVSNSTVTYAGNTGNSPITAGSPLREADRQTKKASRKVVKRRLFAP